MGLATQSSCALIHTSWQLTELKSTDCFHVTVSPYFYYFIGLNYSVYTGLSYHSEKASSIINL